MFKKIKAAAIFFVISLILFPQVLLAEGSMDSKVPELNPLCFTQDECIKARQQRASESNITIGEDEAKGGFVADEGDCKGKTSDDKQWGKCLAGGQTVTEISIGGKSKFKDVGDYIATVYNYVLGIASIIAVVMIIIAGIQWVVSAGNSETISSAKKRITGALVGLVLAYGSYLILNTINPNLVKLRLPQSWMLKQAELIPEFCRDISKKETKLALIKYSNNGTVVNKKMADLTSADDFKYSLLPKDEKSLVCDGVFAPDGGGGATCAGHYCPGNYVCLPNLDNPNGDSTAPKYKCQDAIMGGIVFNNSFFNQGKWSECVSGVEGWNYPWIQKRSGLAPVCNNQRIDTTRSDTVGKFELNEYDRSKGIYSFRLPLSGRTSEEFFQTLNDLSSGYCGSNYEGGIMGYALILFMNENCDFTDEMHIVGRGGVDLGYYDRYFGYTMNLYKNLTPSDLFSSSTLSKGIYIKIDASAIKDND